MAQISPPPPSGRVLPLFYELSPEAILVRIFNPAASYRPGPLTFNYHGAYNRFDPHIPGERRGTIYAARTLSCCLVEVFGDRRVIETATAKVALFQLRRPVTLLDLTGNGAMAAGTITAIGGVPDRALTQAWARYFYESDVYNRCQGIRYHGAHNNEECFVFFERSEEAFPTEPVEQLSLYDPDILPEVLRTANSCGMRVHFE